MNIPPLISRSPPPLACMSDDDDCNQQEPTFSSFIDNDVIVESGFQNKENENDLFGACKTHVPPVRNDDTTSIDSGFFVGSAGPSYSPRANSPQPYTVPKNNISSKCSDESYFFECSDDILKLNSKDDNIPNLDESTDSNENFSENNKCSIVTGEINEFHNVEVNCELELKNFENKSCDNFFSVNDYQQSEIVSENDNNLQNDSGTHEDSDHFVENLYVKDNHNVEQNALSNDNCNTNILTNLEDNDFDDFQSYEGFPSIIENNIEKEKIEKTEDTVPPFASFIEDETNKEFILNNCNDVNTSTFNLSTNDHLNSNLSFLTVQHSSENDWQIFFPEIKIEQVITTTLQKELKFNKTWNCLNPVTERAPHNFNWSGSNSYRKLLSSINVDPNNIFYNRKWNKSLIMKSDSESSENKSERDDKPLTPNKETVPDAHFDWVGSGLTNPLDLTACEEPLELILSAGILSNESEQFLLKLPDLSFMLQPIIIIPKYTT